MPVRQLDLVLLAAGDADGTEGHARRQRRRGLYELVATQVVTASRLIVVRGPVAEQMRLSVTVEGGVDLPSTFGGLQVSAAAADIPMLGQGEDLVGADGGPPEIEEA